MTSESMIRGYKAGRFNCVKVVVAKLAKVLGAYHRNEFSSRCVWNVKLWSFNRTKYVLKESPYRILNMTVDEAVPFFENPKI
jgi:hypothetical protein